MDSLENIKDLLKSCLLPELKQDLDSIPIEREHFKTYHECLQIQLPLLYDWIQQHQPQKSFVDSHETENAQQELQACLIVLLCEISFPNSIFKLNNTALVQNAEQILEDYGHLTEEIEHLIFMYYEGKLHKDKWKRQPGAVHSFVKYLEFHCSHGQYEEQNMSTKFLMFCLSVGLNIRSCYETHYKTLSTSIFLIMLKQGANNDILSMNIHSVIYDAVFKDIHIMDSISLIVKQWDCLINCLDFYEMFNSLTWSYLDDMMEVLIRNISLAPDSEASICLLKFVSKLIIYFNINNKQFEELLSADLTQVESINECRSLGITNTSYTNYRWAKNILQMFTVESHKLTQSSEMCKQFLLEIHRIYIVSILPINLTIIEPQLIKFLEKFLLILMEAVKVQKYQEDIMQLITSLLETFYFHLKSCEESLELHEFKVNIYRLIKLEPFKKYVSI